MSFLSWLGVESPIQLFGYVIFIVVILFYQKLQLIKMKFSVELGLRKLLKSYEKARNFLIDLLGEEWIERIDEIVEFIFIVPHSLDPSQIMNVIERNLETAKKILRKELSKIMKDPKYEEILRHSTFVHITSEHLLQYKIIRHMLLFYKKYGIPQIIMLAVVVMPLIMERKEAFEEAHRCFREDLPIGDSIGSMIVGQLARDFGVEKWKLDKENDMLYAYAEPYKRITFARAIELTTGNLASFVRSHYIQNGYSLRRIITIDAALGLCGEKLGTYSRGVGAACGGSGVERRIMEHLGCETTAHVIKMDMISAYGELNRSMVDRRGKFQRFRDWLNKREFEPIDITRNNTRVVERIKEEIGETSGRVLILGIGNAIGIKEEIEE